MCAMCEKDPKEYFNPMANIIEIVNNSRNGRLYFLISLHQLWLYE